MIAPHDAISLRKLRRAGSPFSPGPLEPEAGSHGGAARGALVPGALSATTRV